MNRSSFARLAARSVPIEAVVIGASAGGVDALLQILDRLPATYRLPIMVVLHVPDDRQSQLAQVFQPRTGMRVKEAADKESLERSTLYFAASGYHLSVELDRSFSLSREAPVHHSRPAIDFLFESAAEAFGAALAGVLLTGANQDGAVGLSRIKQSGGLTVVQDPQEAQAPTMPQAALALHTPDFILGIKEIRALLVELDKTSC